MRQKFTTQTHTQTHTHAHTHTHTHTPIEVLLQLVAVYNAAFREIRVAANQTPLVVRGLAVA